MREFWVNFNKAYKEEVEENLGQSAIGKFEYTHNEGNIWEICGILDTGVSFFSRLKMFVEKFPYIPVDATVEHDEEGNVEDEHTDYYVRNGEIFTIKTSDKNIRINKLEIMTKEDIDKAIKEYKDLQKKIISLCQIPVPDKTTQIKETVRKYLNEIYNEYNIYLVENFGEKICEEITQTLITNNSKSFSSKDIDRKMIEGNLFWCYMCKMQ